MTKFALLSLLLLTSSAVYSQSGSGDTTPTPYLEIATPFVVNIRTETGLSFLQVSAQFRLTRPDLRTNVSKHLPALQHYMIMVLGEQDVKTLRTLEGKKQLRETAVKELQTFLQKEVGEPSIDEVLFTGFVIQ
jgi:flagellar protein FliL